MAAKATNAAFAIVIFLLTGSFGEAMRDTWKDPATGLVWIRQDNGADVDWNEARAYCKALKTGVPSPWRLPSSDELQGIYAPGLESHGWHIRGDIKLTACCTWSGSAGNAPGAYWIFTFYAGKRYAVQATDKTNLRALCVQAEEGGRQK